MTRTAIIFVPYVSMLSIPPLAPALLKSCLDQSQTHSLVFDFNLAFQKNLDQDTRIEILSWITVPGYTMDTKVFARYQEFVDFCTNQILCFNPDVSAISVFSHESQRFTEDLCFNLKKAQPLMHVIIGGSGVSVHQFALSMPWGQMMLNSGMTDCVLEGEGERIFLDLVQNRTMGWVSVPQIESEHLSDLPVPNFDDYDFDLYGPIDTLKLPITASKGCVRSCKFCDVASIWPRFRYRRGQNVADEMIGIYQRYRISNFAFTDSLINGGLKPFREMNQVLAETLPTTLSYSGQFICRDQRSMPPSDFSLMKLGGCSSVSIGIESGSESVRNHMDKQFSDKDLDYTVEQLLIHGIEQRWNIMVGYPTETDNDWKKTLHLIKKYSVHKNLIKIIPVGVFQLLQNNPITKNEMLESLEIDYHQQDGFNEYNWSSGTNPTNNLKRRAERWFELIDMITDLEMLTPNHRIHQKNMVLKKQLEFYESSDRSIFPIRQQSFQDPTHIN